MAMVQQVYGAWLFLSLCNSLFWPASAHCTCSNNSNNTGDTGPVVMVMSYTGAAYYGTATTTTTTPTDNTTNTSNCSCNETKRAVYIYNQSIVKVAAILELTKVGMADYTEDPVWRANDRMRKGFELFVQWANANRGGIYVNGSWHPLQLTVFDNGGNPNISRDLAKHAIYDLGFSFILGPAGGESNKNIAKVVTDSQQALGILPNCGDASIYHNNSMVYGLLPDAQHRTEPVFSLLGDKNNDALGDQYKELTFAFVQQMDDPIGIQECKGIEVYANLTTASTNGRKMVHKGVKTMTRDINGSFDYNGDDDNSLHKVSQWLETTDADIVFLCVDERICARMLLIFQERNYNPRGLSVSNGCIEERPMEGHFLFGIASWVSELHHVSKLDYSAGVKWTSANFESAYLSMYAPSEEKAEECLTCWQPSHEGAAAFASLEILLYAIEVAGSLVPQDVNAVLNTTIVINGQEGIPTVFGPIVFDHRGQNNATYKLVQKQFGSKFKIVSPLDEPNVVQVVFPKPSWSELLCRLENATVTEYGNRSIFGFGMTRVKEGVATKSVLYYSELMLASKYAAATLDMNEGAAEASANSSWHRWMVQQNMSWTSGLPNYVALLPVSRETSDAGPYDIYNDALENFTRDIFRSVSVTFQVIARDAMLYYLRTAQNDVVCGPCVVQEIAQFEKNQQVRSITGARTCRRCQENNEVAENFANDYRYRVCFKPCQVGMGKISPSQNECQTCPAGKHSIAGECEDCVRGRFTAEPGMNECEECARGKYAGKVGQSECNNCSIGHEAQTLGAGECTMCTEGMYAANEGTSACVLCLPGTIASQMSATACEGCMAGTYSAWGAKVCQECELGKYQNLPNQKQCNEGSHGATFTTRGLKKGNNSFQYWTHQDDSTHTLQWEFCSHVPNACLEHEMCQEGSTGVQCSACLPGFFVPSFIAEHSCEKCPSMAWNLSVTGVAMVCVMLAALGFARLTVASIKRPNDLHMPLLKILIHWGFMCGVFAMLLRNLVFYHRETLDAKISDFTLWFCWLFMEGFMGKPWLETTSWSINCLFQRTEDELKAALTNLKHSDWFQAQWQPQIRQLRNAHEETESDMVIFWLLSPLLVMFLIYLLSIVYLMLYFATHSGSLQEANQFYNELLNEGAAKVRKEYDERSLQPYFDLYKSRVLGIWWPFNYLTAAHKRQGCCYRRRTFGSESRPLCLSVLLLMYGMVIVSVMRPRDCTTYCLQDEDHKCQGPNNMRMLSASTIICDDEDTVDLFWWSTFGCIAWGVIFPLITFAMVQIRKGKLMHEDWWKEENCVLIIGYNARCYWWESVVFVDKFLIAIVAHSGMNDDHQILFQFMLVIIYGAITTAFRPFDKRCHNLLWKVQVTFVIIRVLLCISLEFVLLTNNDFGWVAAIIVVMVVNFAFFFYVFYLLWYYGTTSYMQSKGSGGDSLSWLKIPHTEEQRRPGPIAKLRLTAEKWIDAQHRRAQRRQPYACFDHMLGWVTIVGSRSDLAYPTNIHRGNRCQNAHGLTPLSEAPELPQKEPQTSPEFPLEKATLDHRRYFQEAVSEVMQHIGTGLGKTFSVSLFEFIIRAGMLFAVKYSEDKHDELTDVEKELDETVVKLCMDESFEHAATAHSSNKYLTNLSDSMEHKMLDMSNSNRIKKGTKLHAIAHHKIVLSEEHGETDKVEPILELFADEIKHRPRRNHKHHHESSQSLELSSSFGNTAAGSAIRRASKVAKSSHQAATSIAKNVSDKSGLQRRTPEKISSENRAARRSEFHGDGGDTEILPEDEGIIIPKTNDAAVPKSKRKQLEKWVEHMMEPMLYSHGVRLETLQQGMLRLQMMKKSEVTYMIDKFEEAWVKHNFVKAIILKRYGNLLRDTAVQCDFETQRPEVNASNIAETLSYEELKFGEWATVEENDETRDRENKAAMKWARLAIMFGHSLSLFTSKDLVKVVKRKKQALCDPEEAEVSRERAKLEIMRQYLQAQLGQHSSQTRALPPRASPGKMEPYSPTTPTFRGAPTTPSPGEIPSNLRPTIPTNNRPS